MEGIAWIKAFTTTCRNRKHGTSIHTVSKFGYIIRLVRSPVRWTGLRRCARTGEYNRAELGNHGINRITCKGHKKWKCTLRYWGHKHERQDITPASCNYACQLAPWLETTQYKCDKREWRGGDCENFSPIGCLSGWQIKKAFWVFVETTLDPAFNEFDCNDLPVVSNRFLSTKIINNHVETFDYNE